MIIIIIMLVPLEQKGKKKRFKKFGKRKVYWFKKNQMHRLSSDACQLSCYSNYESNSRKFICGHPQCRRRYRGRSSLQPSGGLMQHPARYKSTSYVTTTYRSLIFPVHSVTSINLYCGSDGNLKLRCYDVTKANPVLPDLIVSALAIWIRPSACY